MTFVKVCWIFCDVCNDPEPADVSPPVVETVSEQRERIRKAMGWSFDRRRREDLCPACTKAREGRCSTSGS